MRLPDRTALSAAMETAQEAEYAARIDLARAACTMIAAAAFDILTDHDRHPLINVAQMEVRQTPRGLLLATGLCWTTEGHPFSMADRHGVRQMNEWVVCLDDTNAEVWLPLCTLAENTDPGAPVQTYRLDLIRAAELLTC